MGAASTPPGAPPATQRPGAQATAAQRPGTRAPATSPAAQAALTPAPGSRPSGRRQWFNPSGEELSRSQRRDAEARAALKPLAPGERPPAIIASSVVAAGMGLANLIAYATGEKIGGSRPAAGGILVFAAVMLACAFGLWRMWYGAVLGFMALLAIIVTVFALLLVEASNLLGVVVAVAVIAFAGFLFFKLVRVLSRIQMPKRPGA